MCIIAIFGKICIQRDAVFGQCVEFGRQGIQLGMDTFEVVVYSAMHLLQLAAALLVMAMDFADHLKLWSF